MSQESPEKSPKSDREVTPNPNHAAPVEPPVAPLAAHADAADPTGADARQPANAPEEAPQTEGAGQSPEEVPETPADVLAEAALGRPAEDDAEPEEEIEEVPSSPAEIPAEAVVEDEEPEPGVSGNADAKSGADAEAPEIEAAEAAFDQPIEPAAEVEPQGSETAKAEGSATKADSPQLPPKATAAPQQVAQVVKREEGPDTSPVSVLVSQVYEGPLDLLLDLIRKQDIDIYDIPIAKITAQFLVYVDKLKASDMDVAGEFIYTASLLIHIKSKMLLPRAPSGPDDMQEDPRRELVERLLEHERFKNAAQMLQQKQMLESATWTNPGMREFREDAKADAEIAADTTDLVRIFREILERARNRPILNLQEDSVTVGQMIQFLTRRLTMEDKPVALRRLLSQTRSERALIAMFLALLELVRLQAILLRQDRQFSEIFIKKNSGFDAFMNQGSARDDWQ